MYLQVVIPCNTTATVVLPDGASHTIGSGKYHYECKYPYSKELKKLINVDYDIGELIETGKLNKASAIFRRMTAGYRIKRALMSAGSFASEDETPSLAVHFTATIVSSKVRWCSVYSNTGTK